MDKALSALSSELLIFGVGARMVHGVISNNHRYFGFLVSLIFLCIF